MNRKRFLTSTGILLAFVLTSCRGENPSNVDEKPNTPQTGEVTQPVTQTIEVTQPVQQPTFETESKITSTVVDPVVTPLTVTVQSGSFSFSLDPDYFDGLIILTEYYTLLDHGFYEESYQLLSSSQQKRVSYEDYVVYHKADTKGIKIKGILPYNYFLIRQGLPARQIPPDELRYFVFVTIFHNGPAWNKGGTPIPDDKTGFQALVLEDNEWKIDQLNTSPWTR